MFYLKSLSNENRINAFKLVASFDVPCFIIPNVNDFGQDLIDIATDQGIAVFTTPHETTKAIYLLTDFLDDQFSPYSPIHGSFIDVYGVGILFIGRSGIGKSEIALDLIERGHRLVADDVVMVTRKGEGILMGSGTKLTQHFMEVRGLGLLNVREMFGIRAIRFQKRVEVIVELEEWHPDVEYTRTGLDDNFTKILDVDIPYLKLPIFPGKNVTVIAEVISLNYLLKHYGYNAAKVFTEKLRESLKKKVEETDRSIHYFENDSE